MNVKTAIICRVQNISRDCSPKTWEEEIKEAIYARAYLNRGERWKSDMGKNAINWHVNRLKISSFIIWSLLYIEVFWLIIWSLLFWDWKFWFSTIFKIFCAYKSFDLEFEVSRELKFSWSINFMWKENNFGLQFLKSFHECN